MNNVIPEWKPIQPLDSPTKQIFYLDFITKKPIEDKNANPWTYSYYQPDNFHDGTWIANYNRDVYVISYTSEKFEIIRTWDHQKKEWRTSTAFDYGELRKETNYPWKRVLALRNKPTESVTSFSKIVLPKINKIFPSNFFEISYVNTPADRVGCAI
jgi:hypothetical protein